ncbi:sweet taste receptor activity protein [Homalodisca vitripennis]|nr:sweet taste receptor activity protein [Homalodisca vitripennis]
MPRNSLHQLMRPTLLVAQACGLFPVRGITKESSYKLRFRWQNWCTLYSLVMWITAVAVLVIVWETEQQKSTEPLSILNARLLDVVAPPLVIFPLFLLVSRRWRQFVLSWEVIENKLPDLARSPPRVQPDFKLKIVLIFFITSRLGFIAVAILVGLWMCASCLQLEFWSEYLWPCLVLRYQEQFPFSPLTVWKSTLLVLLEVLGTLQWISCSLVITCLSIILTAHFKAYNHQLEAFKLQLMPPSYWQDMRNIYNNLSVLTSLLDTLLSPLIFATFILESLNIIILFYWVINFVKDPATYLMAGFASVKVLMVNFLTQFSVAALYQESRTSLSVFSFVPSLCYCQEIQRLQEQMTADTIALSGCQFFYVTRSVILTVVSTIVTYEVVLIQFGDLEPPVATNSSLPSYCRTWVVSTIVTYEVVLIQFGDFEPPVATNSSLPSYCRTWVVSTIVTYEVVLIQFGDFEPPVATNSSLPSYCRTWVVSTIVTYEVVLIQFGDFEPPVATNSSLPSYCRTWVVSTIVTYEVVLIQFGDFEPPVATNSSLPSYCRTWVVSTIVTYEVVLIQFGDFEPPVATNSSLPSYCRTWVVSTIVTYEVVLIQFGDFEPPVATNSSLPSYCRTWVVSTIVTYEVVLIQFGDFEPPVATNSSLPSYCRTWVVSTIVTYEVVLIQFGDFEPPVATNSSLPFYFRTWVVSTIVTYEVVLIQFGDFEPPVATNSSLPSYCLNRILPAYNSYLLYNNRTVL